MALTERRSTRPKSKYPVDRDQLITQYLPYVKRIVHRIAIHLPANVEIEDLINVGVIGLMQAIDRFDPQRQNKFLTYAVFRIKGAVLSELRSRDFLSRTNRKKIRELENSYLQLEQKLGRDVDDAELADEMGIGIDQLHEIKKMSSISFISFEDLGCRSREDKDTFMNYVLNSYATDALSLTRLKEIKEAIADAITRLPEKERMVISLYYMDELTMKETGKVLEITESRVSQIHSQAIIHLRDMLRKENLLEN